ncbi:MAG: peptidyl-prolyl cis-trans isomerase [Pseudohongiella sp.]|nr:MAG: peptidyl-prolyl cis-trans isomerase [Pseudohongiella sp.]
MTLEAAPSIATGSLVSLHFSLALTTGELIDSNFEQNAASFRLGDGSMLPGFEQALLGLSKDDEIETLIPAEQAFGEINPSNRHRFPIAKFRNLLEDDLIPMEVGAVVSFKDAGGFDLPGVIAELNEAMAVVDFNHPLAGKDIIFKARIESVIDADVDAVEIKV